MIQHKGGEIAERVRITGKDDGTNDNEGIDVQVDPTYNAAHVKSHLFGYDGIGFTREIRANADGSLVVNPSETTNLEGLGDVAIGVTQVAIAITGTPTQSIRIQADNTNTGIIFIGKTGVLSNKTNDFVRLESGDEVVMGYNDATNALYAISDTAAQTINVGVLL